MKINLASESLDPSLSVCVVSRWSHHASHVLFLFSLLVLSIFPYSVTFIRLTVKILYKPLSDSIYDTSILDRYVDSITQQLWCKVKTSSHVNAIIKDLTAGRGIESNRIVSWQTLWYRQISYHHPKNWYIYNTRQYSIFHFLLISRHDAVLVLWFRHNNKSQKTSDVSHQQHRGSATIAEAGDENQLDYVKRLFVRRMKWCRLHGYVINSSWR